MNDPTSIQAFAGAAMTLLFSVIVAGAGWAWLRLIIRHGRGQPLWEYESRRPVPWGLVDLLVVGFLFFGIQVTTLVLGSMIFGRPVAGELSTGLTLMSALGSLLTGFAAVGYLRWQTGANSHDLGELPWSARQDLRDGATMFLLVIVPVFLVQFVLSRYFPPKHPLITTLLENPSVEFFVIGSFLAVIVAPVVEEYLFRVILQGWLENVAFAMVVGPDHFDSSRLLRPHRPQNCAREDLPGDDRDDVCMTSVTPGHWPIVVSSFVFALAHIGHSADAIPLFLFALGLGWLYQKTHRVWPCIVVHMLLNSLTMIQLAIYVVLQP